MKYPSWLAFVDSHYNRVDENISDQKVNRCLYLHYSCVTLYCGIEKAKLKHDIADVFVTICMHFLFVR